MLEKLITLKNISRTTVIVHQELNTGTSTGTVRRTKSHRVGKLHRTAVRYRMRCNFVQRTVPVLSSWRTITVVHEILFYKILVIQNI